MVKQMVKRRQFLVSAGAIAAPGISQPPMYGFISKITSTSGHRSELIATLGSGTRTMPGCISYVISEDVSDENAIWVTEVWDSKASHDSSLSLPAVKVAIAKARPMMAGFAKIAETHPVEGVSH